MMTRSEPECSATIPPPLRRRYVIITGWPLSAVALGASPLRRKRPFAGRAEPGERRSITVIRRRYADRPIDNLWWPVPITV